MAFPVPAARNNSETAVSGTSHSVAMPAGVQSGNLLLVVIGFNGGVSVPFTATGWTSIGSDDVGGVGQAILFRIADGSEGANVTFTSGQPQVAVHRSWRFTGHHVSTAPEAALLSITSGTPDPPALNPTNWDAEDTYWITTCAISDNLSVQLSAPTNYSQLFADDVGADLGFATAERELNAASEDPGAWGVGTIPIGIDKSTATIAIRPAVAVGLTPPSSVDVDTNGGVSWTNGETERLKAYASKQGGSGLTYTLAVFDSTETQPLQIIDAVTAPEGAGTYDIWLTHFTGDSEDPTLESAPSNVDTFVVGALPETPVLATPTINASGNPALSVSSGGGNTTDISLERSPAGAGTWTVIHTFGVFGGVFEDTTAAADTQYDYRAVANDRETVLTDPFTGTDNDPPNPANWAVSGTGANSSATIQSNALQLAITGTPGGFVEPKIISTPGTGNVQDGRLDGDTTVGVGKLFHNWKVRVSAEADDEIRVGFSRTADGNNLDVRLIKEVNNVLTTIHEQLAIAADVSSQWLVRHEIVGNIMRYAVRPFAGGAIPEGDWDGQATFNDAELATLSPVQINLASDEAATVVVDNVVVSLISIATSNVETITVPPDPPTTGSFVATSFHGGTVTHDLNTAGTTTEAVEVTLQWPEDSFVFTIPLSATVPFTVPFVLEPSTAYTPTFRSVGVDGNSAAFTGVADTTDAAPATAILLRVEDWQAPTAGDQALFALLDAAPDGFSPVYVSWDQYPSLAPYKVVIVTPGGPNTEDLDNTIATASKPVLALRYALALLLADLGATTGETTTQITITDDTHPLAAGFPAGALTVLSAANNISGTTDAGLCPGAETVARRGVGVTHWALFWVPQGGELANASLAPAHRAAFLLNDDASLAALSANGETIVLNAVRELLPVVGAGFGRLVAAGAITGSSRVIAYE